jgi:hypothetical protein
MARVPPSSGRRTMPETYQYREGASRNGRIISPVKSASFILPICQACRIRLGNGPQADCTTDSLVPMQHQQAWRIGAPPVEEFLVSDGRGAVSGVIDCPELFDKPAFLLSLPPSLSGRAKKLKFGVGWRRAPRTSTSAAARVGAAPVVASYSWPPLDTKRLLPVLFRGHEPVRLVLSERFSAPNSSTLAARVEICARASAHRTYGPLRPGHKAGTPAQDPLTRPRFGMRVHSFPRL